MTNKDIKRIAYLQSSYDFSCDPALFTADENTVLVSQKNERARDYLPLPFACDLVSYGNCIVAQTSEELLPIVKDYIGKYPTEHAFETPNLHILNDALLPHGYKICFMAEYFLPDVEKLRELPCGYELRVLSKKELLPYYKKEFSNALSSRPERDVMGIGAFDGEKLIGLAACSSDCELMYQIGVDVLPEYRRRGVASAVTSKLALEIIKLGRVPFYCAAWCNVKSVGNAFKCGFYPAWCELTARDIEFTDSMNR